MYDGTQFRTLQLQFGFTVVLHAVAGRVNLGASNDQTVLIANSIWI